MPPRPPDQYCTLPEALGVRNKKVNIIGMVTDYMTPIKSRGEDFICTLHIQDADLFSSHHDPNGLTVRCFGRTVDRLPNIKALGDIMIFRNTMIKEFRGEVIASPDRNSKWVVIYSESVPRPPFQAPFDGGRQLPHSSTHFATELSAQEQDYAIYLKDSLEFPGVGTKVTKELQALPARSAAPVSTESPKHAPLRGDKFSFIKDVRAQEFYELVGEVVKIFPLAMGDVEIYITDYTFNSLLPHPDGTPNAEAEDRYGDKFRYTDRTKGKWPGPYGNMTLKVELKPPHSVYARDKLSAGDFVALLNVRIKTDLRAHLEGNMWEDRRFPSRLDIKKLVDNKDERVRNLKMRKEQFEKSLHPNGDTEEPAKKPLSKSKKKKLQQRKDWRAKAEAKERNILTPKGLEQGNQHVECAHRSIQLATLDQIVDTPFLQEKTPSGIERTLPFINAEYRSRIRIVDFHPQNLEDFAHSLHDPMYGDTALSDSEDADLEDISMEMEKNWEWAFYILVEDARQPKAARARTQLKLLVAGSEAEGLLKLDATDLRKDEETLSKLREKLFILWGDLEEVKAKAAARGDATDSDPSRHESSGMACSSRPFECCIMEYGVPINKHEVNEEDADPQWARMHKMFGTTIMD